MKENDITIKNFFCQIHGKVRPTIVPKCPECTPFPTEPSVVYETEIEKIVEKVREVEFLHGVPVRLPTKTVELLRSGIRHALLSTSLTMYEKGREEAIKQVEEKLPEVKFPDFEDYLEMVEKARERGKYDEMYANGWNAALSAVKEILSTEIKK